jgi:hypothetical protein
MTIKLKKELMAAQNKITDMEKAVRFCESRIPELSQAAMRFLDIAHYVEKEIDEETYFDEMDKISKLGNKFRHECSCTKILKR